MQKPDTEDILVLPPAYKLYKDRDIGIATFLGGPLVAGYLAAENYKRLGQLKNARTTWLLAIFGSVIIFCAVFMIPYANFPAYPIPILYTLISRFLVQKYQGASLRAHAATGGEFYTVWRAVLVSLIVLVITAALLIGVFFLVDIASPFSR